MDPLRKIIHIDMDAFYASVEQRDNPELRGKPLAVGGSKERGVVAAASYEARKFGVRSAMASKIAYQKCPQLIFVPPDFAKYRAVSAQIMNIFERYTDLVEPLSLDEAYLDVTENKKNIVLATDVAKEIKELIRQETSLTASAGVSFNKFLAKVASGWQKPNGLTVITPNKATAFLEQLPIEDFHGIGKVTAEKMKGLHIFTGKDLKALTEEELVKSFGDKAGRYYFRMARAIDNRPVEPFRTRRSIGAEETFEQDIDDVEEMKQRLQGIAEDVAKRCEKHGSKGKTITLKIKYKDFVLQTRSRTLLYFTNDVSILFETACALLGTPENPVKPVRLLGITIHNLDTDPDTKSVRNLPPALQLKLDL